MDNQIKKLHEKLITEIIRVNTVCSGPWDNDTKDAFKKRNLLEQGNEFFRYAVHYNCSPFESIKDRDCPMTKTEIISVLDVMGLCYSEKDLSSCYPNSDDDARRLRRDFDSEVRGRVS